MRSKLLLAAIGLGLAGCGEGKAPAATVAEPAFASTWYLADGAAPQIAVNIHDTALGKAGFVRDAQGDLLPIRNVVVTDTDMSFVVPDAEATWRATRGADGAWTGIWAAGSAAPEYTLRDTPAPDLDADFVVFEDGRWNAFTCAGAGSPAVILDYGAGGSMGVWKDVFGPISHVTRTCMFERAGRGLSDPGRMPRDVNTAVADIDAFIAAAKIEGPVVLVGHSMASYHVRQFANLHKDGDVAGIVLVDPSGDGQTARFLAAIPNFAELAPEKINEDAVSRCAAALRERLAPRGNPVAAKCNGNDPDRVEATLSEIAAMEVVSTGQLVAARRPYGDLPMIVLTRGDYEKGMPPEFTAQSRVAMAKVWTEMHAEMAAQSNIGETRVVAGAGHFIQGDKPQAVIDAVSEVVTKARARSQGK